MGRQSLSIMLVLLMLTLSFGCNNVANEKATENKIEWIRNEFADDFLAKVHTHKDIKDSKWLVDQLKTENPKHLLCLFNAFASVKDSLSFYPLKERIIKEGVDDSLFVAGMNALGLLGPKDSTSVMIEMLYPDIATSRSESILIAIGNMGSANGCEYLINQKLSPGMMEGLYRSFLQGNSGVDVIEKAALGISHKNRAVRFWAGNILNRQREHDVSPFFDEFKIAYSSEMDREVKILLAGCFKKMVGSDKSTFINEQLQTVQDPLLLVNLIRSVDSTDFASTYKNLISLTNHPNEQVAVSAITRLGILSDGTLNDDIARIEPMVNNANVKALLLSNLIKHDDDKTTWSSKAKQYFSVQEIPIVKAGFVRALANDTANFNWIRNILSDLNKPILQGVAHEVLLNKAAANDRDKLVEMGLKSSNVSMICQSAGAIDKSLLKVDHERWLNLIDKKIEELKLPKELEALVELNKAKAELTGEPQKKANPQYNHPLKWQQINKLPNRPTIELTSDKGVIIWTLYLDKVPAAVATIVNLIDSGYYNDKVFHRIVPNFVAQGGCPRGDGWGSLDFSLRSEYAHGIDYKSGAIGLASAGENTESCQFFMCHSATPHLDNRYTIIGYVTEGYDILQRIELGDKIISMKRLN